MRRPAVTPSEATPAAPAGSPLGGRAARPSLRGVAVQTALIGGAALAYFGVRALTEGSLAEAVRNARSVADVEASLGLPSVAGVQRVALDRSWLETAANWTYSWGHWPVVAVALLWLYLGRRTAFLTLRDAMFISGAIGLIVFALFPVAPPRLAGIGVLDTVTMHTSAYRALQPPALLNRYAAMPSLHFGWNMLVGIAIWHAARWRPVRVFAVLMPVAMAFAVVATANHFPLDVLAGAIVALAGLALVPVVRSVVARAWPR